MKISIIIPVYNEETTLPVTLSQLKLSDNEELVVVDGGSNDRTLEISKRFTEKVFVTEKGRGRQLRKGAELATGGILFFLHADCLPPENAFSIIREVILDSKIAAGTFDIGIHFDRLASRIIEFGANLRSHITKLPYGDQGLFMKKETYEKIGGFKEIPIMEDVEIAQRLKKQGKIIFVREKINTSTRRWEKEGILYTTVRDWILAISYTLFKVSPERLLKYYKDVR